MENLARGKILRWTEVWKEESNLQDNEIERD